MFHANVYGVFYWKYIIASYGPYDTYVSKYLGTSLNASFQSTSSLTKHTNASVREDRFGINYTATFSFVPSMHSKSLSELQFFIGWVCFFYSSSYSM